MLKVDNLVIRQRLHYLIMLDNIGYPPTVREIARAWGLKSTSSTSAALLDMENAGLIAILRDDAGRARAYKLTLNGTSTIGLSLDHQKDCKVCHGTSLGIGGLCNCIVMRVDTGVK